MTRWLVSVVLVAVLWPTAGLTAPKDDNTRSLALLPSEGRRIDADTLGLLSDLLAARLDRLENRRLITMREIQSMLGFERTKEMLACGEGDSCVAEIGGALGVDEVLQASLGRLAGELMISLSLINIATSQVVARVMVKVDDDESDYEEGIDEAVTTLFAQAPVSVKPGVGPPKAEATAVVAPSASSGPSTTSWLLMVGGAGALGAGGYFGMQAQAKSDEAFVYGVGGQAAAEEGAGHKLMANVFYGVGAVVLGTGLGLWLLSEPEGSPPTSVAHGGMSWAPWLVAHGGGIMVWGELW